MSAKTVGEVIEELKKLPIDMLLYFDCPVNVDRPTYSAQQKKVAVVENTGKKEQPMSESLEEHIPDLYQLAYIPGVFKCPQCGFVLSKATLNVAQGVVGTTERDRESPECPNDGTFMVHVTYREQLEECNERCFAEIQANAALKARAEAAEARVAILEKEIELRKNK